MIRKSIIVMLTLGALGMLLLAIVTVWLPVWRAYGSEADFLKVYVGDGVAEVSYGFVGDLTVVLRQRQQRLGKVSVTWVDNRERRFRWGGLAWDVSYGGGKGGWSGGSRIRLCAGSIPINHPCYQPPPEVEPKPRTFTKPTINIVHQIRVPLWIPITLFATYPCCWFTQRAWNRYQRGKRNQCIGCGYNLTGNESGVCPECGEAI